MGQPVPDGKAHGTIGVEVRRGTYDVVVDVTRAGSVELNGTFEMPVKSATAGTQAGWRPSTRTRVRSSPSGGRLRRGGRNEQDRVESAACRARSWPGTELGRHGPGCFRHGVEPTRRQRRLNFGSADVDKSDLSLNSGDAAMGGHVRRKTHGLLERQPRPSPRRVLAAMTLRGSRTATLLRPLCHASATTAVATLEHRLRGRCSASAVGHQHWDPLLLGHKIPITVITRWRAPLSTLRMACRDNPGRVSAGAELDGRIGRPCSWCRSGLA
jgi:hypothetical protein